MCAFAGVGTAGSAGGSAGISAPALARLRHFDSHSARPASRSGGSPRAAAGRACAAGSGGAPPLEPERKATRLGGPLECSSLDWTLEGSWRERFRRVRRSELQPLRRLGLRAGGHAGGHARLRLRLRQLLRLA